MKHLCREEHDGPRRAVIDGIVMHGGTEGETSRLVLVWSGEIVAAAGGDGMICKATCRVTHNHNNVYQVVLCGLQTIQSTSPMYREEANTAACLAVAVAGGDCVG